ncbi:Ditrans,polycis-undecaprenyl-diphosphate synthase ((2E,6E)-farnesyl-diphosphate specific) [Sphingobium sp. AntQ-1]|uniref:isoprenyl transferase n=1 Tax=Sphingobium sp. AntQ-1 TaxID=2930091 RepID=UPI00234EE7C7|nr:isoprenyl transferase [Sphingobium sp. AntQ-1]WCP12514.1 Ditrans,polycis-undecaprenyl-diphosphate synthase ((2E,6E)-farnesyl-diphosphate specific) [Sphingobium sp. AntQ-1]
MATQAKPDLTSVAPAHGARHVAIIMDGNGRWAKKRLLPRVAGHRAGVEAVRKVARAAQELGLECLTLYAFSSENWKRPASEVADLMGLLRHFIQSDIDEMHGHGVRLRVIGDYRALEPSLVELIESAMARTAGNSGPIVAIALNYGAQDEMVQAVQALAARAAAGEIAADAIGAADIDRALYTADLPPLDLMIRTSGEQRLSNFMLWQAAYAELYFTDMLWPDFDGRALAQALDAFRLRDRRFGGL